MCSFEVAQSPFLSLLLTLSLVYSAAPSVGSRIHAFGLFGSLNHVAGELIILGAARFLQNWSQETQEPLRGLCPLLLVLLPGLLWRPARVWAVLELPVSNLRSLAVHEVLRGFEQGQVGAFFAPFGGLL